MDQHMSDAGESSAPQSTPLESSTPPTPSTTPTLPIPPTPPTPLEPPTPPTPPIRLTPRTPPPLAVAIAKTINEYLDDGQLAKVLKPVTPPPQQPQPQQLTVTRLMQLRLVSKKWRQVVEKCFFAEQVTQMDVVFEGSRSASGPSTVHYRARDPPSLSTVEYCFSATGGDIKELNTLVAALFPHVAQLNFTYPTVFTGRGHILVIQELLHEWKETLTAITLTIKHELEKYENEMLWARINALANLKELNLTLPRTYQLPTNMSALGRVAILRLVNFGGDIVPVLAECSPVLRCLSLVKVPCTEKQLTKVQDNIGHNVTHFTFSGRKTHGEGVFKFACTNFPSLRGLAIDCINSDKFFLFDQINTNLSNLTKLRSLSISLCPSQLYRLATFDEDRLPDLSNITVLDLRMDFLLEQMVSNEVGEYMARMHDSALDSFWVCCRPLVRMMPKLVRLSILMHTDLIETEKVAAIEFGFKQHFRRLQYCNVRIIAKG